jgi:hypothetical protein
MLRVAIYAPCVPDADAHADANFESVEPSTMGFVDVPTSVVSKKHFFRHFQSYILDSANTLAKLAANAPNRASYMETFQTAAGMMSGLQTYLETQYHGTSVDSKASVTDGYVPPAGRGYTRLKRSGEQWRVGRGPVGRGHGHAVLPEEVMDAPPSKVAGRKAKGAADANSRAEAQRIFASAPAGDVLQLRPVQLRKLQDLLHISTQDDRDLMAAKINTAMNAIELPPGVQVPDS